MHLNEKQLKEYGKELGQKLGPGAILALTGELGVGKTTLAKAVAAGLGVIETVTSPTFTLINEYKSGRLPFYHFDVYRLEENEAEKALAEIGYEEYFFGIGVTVVEWADRVRGLLPDDALWIELRHTDDPDIRELKEVTTIETPVIARSEMTKQLGGSLGAGARPEDVRQVSVSEYKGLGVADAERAKRAEASANLRRSFGGEPHQNREHRVILAIETTGPICSVALRTNDGRIYHRASEEGLMHLTSLMPMVRDVLDEAGIPTRKLDLIAVSSGPGSFTGIRIGIATVRALAQTLDIQVIKVPTLETFVYLTDTCFFETDKPADANDSSAAARASSAIASEVEQSSENINIQKHIIACPIFDARRDQMYAGAYTLEPSGKIMPLVAGDAHDPEEYFSALSASAQAFKKLTERSAGDRTAGSETISSETRVIIKLMGDGLPAFIKSVESFKKVITGFGIDVLTEGYPLLKKDDCLQDSDNHLPDCDVPVSSSDAPVSNSDTHVLNKDENIGRIIVQDALAALAWAESNGKPVGYGELEPIYMRKAEAQRRLDEKQAASADTVIASETRQSIGALRRATEDDVYGISVVERLSFGEPWLEKSILDDIRLEYSDYIVCEKGGVILGYAGLHRILEEGHITNIAVHPSVRNRGLGKAILGELMSAAEKKGIKDFTLEVRAGDEKTIRFYERLGFVTEGIRKDYYPKENAETNESGSLKMGGGREDACIMWRRSEDEEPSSC